jgi:hypothetical protein
LSHKHSREKEGGRIKYFINERDASCPTQRLNLKDGGKRKEE